jgi:hypothetical protein
LTESNLPKTTPKSDPNPQRNSSSQQSGPAVPTRHPHPLVSVLLREAIPPPAPPLLWPENNKTHLQTPNFDSKQQNTTIKTETKVDRDSPRLKLLKISPNRNPYLCRKTTSPELDRSRCRSHGSGSRVLFAAAKSHHHHRHHNHLHPHRNRTATPPPPQGARRRNPNREMRRRRCMYSLSSPPPSQTSDLRTKPPQAVHHG